MGNFFIRSSLYISLLSLIIQYIFSIITYNIYDQKKSFIFSGSEEKFNFISDEIINNKKPINLLEIPIDNNLDLINLENINGIIIEDFKKLNNSTIDVIFQLKLRGIPVESLLTWFEKEFHRLPTNIINDKYQLIEKLKSIEDNYQIRTKRIGDIFVSLFILIISSPLILLLMALIYLEDRGPIFYSQIRTGLNGKEIKIIKFRSMTIDAEKEGIQWSSNGDPRITRIGKLIRATRLDELPQLFCVINGSMSLIGPRPERPEIEKELLKGIPYYSCRNILKPGVSGWAQVNYPYGSSVLDTTKKLSYDIYYITHFSFLLDLLILFKTIKIVFNAKVYKSKKIYKKHNLS